MSEPLVVPVQWIPLEEAEKRWPPKPFVVATTCVRRRPWAAAGWVAAMAAQGRRPDAVLVVVDEGEDGDTYRAWWNAGRKTPFGVRFAVNCYPHPSAPGYSRTGPERYSDDQHAHLARLRNWTVERALELWPQATHIWCCDSDITPEPDALELLLAADKPVVGAVVANSKTSYNFMMGTASVIDSESGDVSIEPGRGSTEEYMLQSTAPFRVTMTGACALYRADLFRGQGLGSMDRRDGFGAAAGLLRWGPHKNGEDCALAIKARELGIPLWIEPRARTRHWLRGPNEEPLH